MVALVTFEHVDVHWTWMVRTYEVKATLDSKMFGSIVLVVFLPTVVSPFAVTSSKPPCEDVSFDITVSAHNVAFSPSPDLRNETTIVELINEMMQRFPDGPALEPGTARTTATIPVAATFCRPQTRKPLGVVQVLVHGGMQSKDVWKGWDGPEYYSRAYDYTLVAREKGFHTLAVNLPGRGQSRPDPFGVVQLPLHAEVLYRVIRAVRSGKASDKALRRIARGVKKVVFVGHALGSAVGNALARSHPDAVDAYVLTGYSAQPAFPRITAEELGFANKVALVGVGSYADEATCKMLTPELDHHAASPAPQGVHDAGDRPDVGGLLLRRPV